MIETGITQIATSVIGRSANMEVNYKPLWVKMIYEDLSQKELIQKSGVNKNVISRMRNGEPVNVSNLLKISGALGCTLNDLIEQKHGEKRT